MEKDEWILEYLKSMETRIIQRIEVVETKVDTLMQARFRMLGGYKVLLLFAGAVGFLLKFIIGKFS